MPDPTDYTKKLLPELHYGKVGVKGKRTKDENDDIDDDAPTEQWVIDVLGFDPKKV